MVVAPLPLLVVVASVFAGVHASDLESSALVNRAAATGLGITDDDLPSLCRATCEDVPDEINQGFTGVKTNNTSVWSKCLVPDCVCTTTNSIFLGDCMDCVGGKKGQSIYNHYVSVCKEKTGKDIPARTIHSSSANSHPASVGLIGATVVIALLTMLAV